MHAKQAFWNLRGVFNGFEEQEVIGEKKRGGVLVFFQYINEKSFFYLSCQRIEKISLRYNCLRT